ncbi:M48 family metalloprotease [Streptomyces fildesensis]|uniref:M48 family metalloprotease n=1 Tax=Streptomyces fildesensis TaxID=375757 RepID=A0ABW8CI76_9ACTN
MPSGTLLRFATLILLVLGTTVMIHANFVVIVHLRPESTYGLAHCQVQNNLYLLSDGWVDPDESKWQGYRHCMDRITFPAIDWVLIALALLGLLTAALYFLQPVWRIRRRRLAPLDLQADPALAEELRALVARATPDRPPTWLTDPVSHHTGAVVFGRRRNRVVCLDAGLVALRTRDVDSFRAVVLHELAHLRNRDVTITHATLALWRAFLVVTLLPYALVAVDPMLLSARPLDPPEWSRYSLDSVTATGWRVLLLTPLVYASRASVLRARELYADARVAGWTGTADPYLGLTADPAARRWWRAAWAKHPSRPARTAALARPRVLLRPGFVEALAGGLAVQVAWGHVSLATTESGLSHANNSWSTALQVGWSAAVAALLAVSGWRYAEFRRAGGNVRGLPALVGLALGLGLVAGRFLDLGTGVSTRSLPLTWIGAVDALLLLGFSVGLASWAACLARLLGDRVRSRYGLLSAAALTLTCWVSMGRWTEEGAADGLLSGWLRPVSALLRGYAAQTDWTPWDAAVTHVVVFAFILNAHRLLVVIAVTTLWLLPLLLGGLPWRRTRNALLAGLTGAAVWGGLDLLLRWAARGDLTAGIRGGEAFAAVFSSWEIVALVGVQFAISVWCARRGSVLPAVLLAGAVTGVVGTVALWGLHLADGCGSAVWSVSRTACTGTIDDAIAARPLQVVPVLGTALVLAGAALGRGLRRRGVLAPGSGSGSEQAALRSGRARTAGRAVPFVVAVACVALMAATPAASRDVLKVGEVSRTTPVRDGMAELHIWVAGGGLNQFLLVGQSMDLMFTSFSPFDRAKALARCGQLVSDVGGARMFPPPPEQRAATLWTTGLDSVELGATQCVQAMKRDDDKLLGASAGSFGKANARRKELLAMMIDSLTH